MKKWTYAGRDVTPPPPEKKKGNRERPRPQTKGRKGLVLFARPA